MSTQTVEWVEIDEEKIRQLQMASNICRLRNTMAKYSVSRQMINSLKQGLGIPCECGCEAMIPKGEKVLEVSSLYSQSPDGAHYYYATVECERKGMNDLAMYLRKYRAPISGSIRIVEKQIA